MSTLRGVVGPVLDNEIPGTECPSCHKMLSMATATQGRHQPKPGNITLCLYCGHILVFDEDLRMREPNDEEMREIAGNKTVLRAQAIRAEAMRRLKEKR